MEKVIILKEQEMEDLVKNCNLTRGLIKKALYDIEQNSIAKTEYYKILKLAEESIEETVNILG